VLAGSTHSPVRDPTGTLGVSVVVPTYRRASPDGLASAFEALDGLPDAARFFLVAAPEAR
jgi:hypothetical protein